MGRAIDRHLEPKLKHLRLSGILATLDVRTHKATAEAKEFCRELLEGEVYRRKLRQQLLAGQVAPAFEATLWHYAYGKPKESVDVAGKQELILKWRDPGVEE